MMLASSLRENGYDVQTAYTGPDGLRIAQNWRPDIVLLDIGLPGLDGYEVARRLRTKESTQSARVIALTGYGRDEDIARAREAGFDAHLTKPVDFKDLIKVMASGKRSVAQRGLSATALVVELEGKKGRAGKDACTTIGKDPTIIN